MGKTKSSSTAKTSGVRPVPAIAHGDTSVGGIRISHPARIIFPKTGISKASLAEYYLSVADYMMPYVKDRPLSILRCPEGTGKECFFQRHLGLGKSEHIHEVAIKVKDEERKYIKIHNIKGLLSLVQWGVIEIHPWECSARRLDNPDRLIFDLDPDRAVSFKQLVKSAFEVRERLRQIGLEAFLKTTGGKGLHLVVPIAPIYRWKEMKALARGIAFSMAYDSPNQYIATMSKVARKGKIFIDYLRNDVTSTAVAPFSVRARPGATVSMPIAWEDLKPSLKLAAFNIQTVPALWRNRKSDPWEDYAKTKQKISAKYLRILESAD